MAAVYWIGNDGNVYYGDGKGGGVRNVGKPHVTNSGAFSADKFSANAKQIENPGNPQQPAPAPAPQYTTGGSYSSGSYGGGYDLAAAQAAQAERERIAQRDQLRGEIGGFRGGIENTFAELFRLIDQQAQSRRDSIGRTYDEQNAQYTSEFEKAMPAIATAFAALGLGNSTFAGDREDTTTNEYKGALRKSSTNRESDLADVGRWRDQNVGEYRSQRDNMLASINDAQGSENVNELRDARNNIRTGVNNAQGSKGRFGSDGDAVKSLNANTNRSAGFSDAFNAYQGVLNSSMDTGTKGAVKEAMLQYGDLNEDERSKLTEVQINNPYQTRVS